VGKENRSNEGLSMTEHSNEAPEEQRIKGFHADRVSYQEGQKSQNHTESQNGRGWKGPLWVI